MNDCLVKEGEYRSPDCLCSLDWKDRRDYPGLSDLHDRMSFGDALGTVAGLCGFDFPVDDNGRSVFEELSKRFSFGHGDSREKDQVISDRGVSWMSLSDGMLDANLKSRVDNLVGSGSDFWNGLSRDLGVFTENDYKVRQDELLRLGNQGEGGFQDAYHLITLAFLLYPRVKHKIVPCVEPKADSPPTEDVRQRLRDVFSGLPILNDELSLGNELKGFDPRGLSYASSNVLHSYRANVHDNRGCYPMETLVHQDPKMIREYCFALLRIILGREKDFSDVLQESFITNEVLDLAKSYIAPGENVTLLEAGIGRCLEELWDLRARAFEHNNLLSTRFPTSGIVVPPANFITTETRQALSCGSGKFARFFNGLARGYPNGNFHAIDKEVYGSPNDLRFGYDLGAVHSPNMHLYYGDFDDPGVLNSMETVFSREKGGLDFVDLANILHKLKDPVQFFTFVFNKLVKEQGVLSLCLPAVSEHQDSVGRRVGLSSLASMSIEDRTKNLNAFLSVELLLRVIRQFQGAKIMSVGMIDSRFSQNDSAKRMFVGLRKV